jgi:hypothetical protein
MDKKIIAVIGVYTVIMTALLLLTFAADWNPSGYDYSLNGETLTIEDGNEDETISIEGKYEDAVLFMARVSQVREQWNIDLITTGLLLPFVLLLFVPERRPFRQQLSTNWYATIVSTIAVFYLVYSISTHVMLVSEINTYVERLT